MPIPQHEQNRESWNNATRQHHTHLPDLIERYRNGYNGLYAEDMELLGDLHGKRVVHLQCNDGQDTVSIARFCGGDLTGVDISDYAIEAARRLAEGAGIPTTFVRSDLFDWFDTTEDRFDVVYTSYGALFWLSDIRRWGQGVARVLKSGGKVVIVEFHPTINMFELDWSLGFDYMGGKQVGTNGVGDYVGNDFDGTAFQNPAPSFEYAYGIADIVSALLDAGLTLTHLREYPYMNGWQRFPEMVEREPRRFYLPDRMIVMPLMFSMVAVKTA